MLETNAKTTLVIKNFDKIGGYAVYWCLIMDYQWGRQSEPWFRRHRSRGGTEVGAARRGSERSELRVLQEKLSLSTNNITYLSSQNDDVWILKDEIKLKEAVEWEHDVQNDLLDVDTVVVVDVFVCDEANLDGYEENWMNQVSDGKCWKRNKLDHR